MKQLGQIHFAPDIKNKATGKDRKMLSENIKKLVQYGIETGLTPACEKNYTTNLLLDVFKEDEYTEPEEEYSNINLEEDSEGTS